MTEPAEVTMADLRRACNDRLDYAVKTGEVGLRLYEHDGTKSEHFETPAGLEISRYAGGVLSIKCDFGELDSDEDREVIVDFVDGEEDPYNVTDTVTNDRGRFASTIARKDQNKLAAELSKYVTLVP
jgi:hypothetical protein